jgi:asparagine synthase (glutamine-hydrolysing)
MCGIAGVVRFDGQPVRAADVEAMTATLTHRGPDDGGVHVDGEAGLGHRRLSIIDLSAAGHQPMFTADGNLAIVFNGEIYNFAALRHELELQGVRFRSRSDTEVALQSFAAWGLDAFARFNGMFAMALWDRRTRKLTLARDRFGIKPLYFSRDGQRLSFASEIKALLRLPGGVDDAIDPQALAEYVFYGNSLGERTLYRGVSRLLPGCWLEVEPGRVRTGRYWDITAVEPLAISAAEAVAGVRRRVEAAVQLQLVSDVPIGVFLSGGVDSTAVVAAASAAGAASLRTYTVRFDFDPDSADVRTSRRVASHFGTEHHELDVGGYTLPEVLEKLLDAHDLPFGDAANVPLYLLTRALGGEPKVILQGDGGDELFGGYRRYALLAKLALLGPASRIAQPLLRGLPASQRKARLERMANALGARDPAERMALLLTEEKPDRSPLAIFSPQWRATLAGADPFARYREVARHLAAMDPVQAMLYTDCQILLPDIFLEKVDRSTMAQSIEVRVPLLDHELADFVLALPAAQKLPRGEPKGLFKQSLRGFVPDFVLDRPKAGFGVPYGAWLRGPLRPLLESLLLDPAADSEAIFDHAVVGRLVAEHVSGTRDHSFMLWKALGLAMWRARAARARAGA